MPKVKWRYTSLLKQEGTFTFLHIVTQRFGWCRSYEWGWSSSLRRPVQILVSSGNTVTDTPSHNVLPVIWMFPRPVKLTYQTLTHQISAITVPYLLAMSYVLNSTWRSSSKLKLFCGYILHSTNMSWVPATCKAMGWVMPRIQRGKDKGPALPWRTLSEDNTYNKIWPKKRPADPWEDFLRGKTSW